MYVMCMFDMTVIIISVKTFSTECDNKRGNVRINVTLTRVQVTIAGSGKAVSITYSESVSLALSYPACNAQALNYIAICGLSGSTTFFHIIS
jgi:hypothetical protein